MRFVLQSRLLFCFKRVTPNSVIKTSNLVTYGTMWNETATQSHKQLPELNVQVSPLDSAPITSIKPPWIFSHASTVEGQLIKTRAKGDTKKEKWFVLKCQLIYTSSQSDHFHFPKRSHLWDLLSKLATSGQFPILLWSFLGALD